MVITCVFGVNRKPGGGLRTVSAQALQQVAGVVQVNRRVAADQVKLKTPLERGLGLAGTLIA